MKQLNDLFNIDPIPEQPGKEITVPVPLNGNKELDQEEDYQLARQTMRKLLIKSESTLDELLELSKNSEHPRTYEVAGQLIKTMSDVAKDLLTLQKQVKELNTESQTPSIGTQNNVVFAGSTSELMKLLKKNNE